MDSSGYGFRTYHISVTNINEVFCLPDREFIVLLSFEAISANSIGCFKSKLDKYWGQIGHGYEQRLTAYY